MLSLMKGIEFYTEVRFHLYQNLVWVWVQNQIRDSVSEIHQHIICIEFVNILFGDASRQKFLKIL